MGSTAVRRSWAKRGNGATIGPNDFYDVLGVSRDASEEEIAEAFRRLALRYHPDRNVDREANARFAEASRAYAVLHDDEKRELYDALGPDRYDDPWWVHRYRVLREESAREWEAQKWERRGEAVNATIGSIIFLVAFNSLIPAHVLGPWDYVINFAVVCLFVGVRQLVEA